MSGLRWGHLFPRGTEFMCVILQIFVSWDNCLTILLRFMDPTMSSEC